MKTKLLHIAMILPNRDQVPTCRSVVSATENLIKNQCFACLSVTNNLNSSSLHKNRDQVPACPIVIKAMTPC